MRTSLDAIIEEPFVRNRHYTELEAWLDLQELATIEEASGLVSCHRGTSPTAGWPRCNPLLPGLAKINRRASSYKSWVRTAWNSAQKGFGTRRAMERKVNMSFNAITRVVDALKRGQRRTGWEKVEARLLIPHGAGFAGNAKTLPPGISSTPHRGGGRYLRVTNSNIKSLRGYASQAYGPYKASKGASAIDNHPYNSRYWKYGPSSNSYRIDLGSKFECDLVKLHQVSSFGSPAPRGRCRPVLFLPFEFELDKFAR